MKVSINMRLLASVVWGSIRRMSKGLIQFLSAIGAFFLEGALQVSGYQNLILAWGLGLLGMVLLIVPLWQSFSSSRNFAAFSFGLIPLNAASLKAYEELRGTKFGTWVEQLNPRKELEFYANALAEKGVVYGNHPPSTKREIVNTKRAGFIQQDGKSIGLLGGDIVFDNLMIERKNLRNYIKEHLNIKWYKLILNPQILPASIRDR